MANQDSIVVYDILRDGIGVAPVVMSFVLLVISGGLVAALVSERRQRKPVGGNTLALILWAALCIPGEANVWYQHFRCVAWARSGDFELVEGQITQFYPGGWWNKDYESFTVSGPAATGHAGITFKYGPSNLGHGGFRYSFGSDGLLHQGSRVMVAYREGRILKLEILKE